MDSLLALYLLCLSWVCSPLTYPTLYDNLFHHLTFHDTVFSFQASKPAKNQIHIVRVRDDIEAAYPALSFGTSSMTEGDKNQSRELYILGRKALWTKNLRLR
ncbi:hypothetical protein BDR07DRAFT_1386995 [Suillus spraguei]|nr:hypothetical protein BDR07DRAFT_1386995 [Suillus spraguei]